jgi:hypothetical protein
MITFVLLISIIPLVDVEAQIDYGIGNDASTTIPASSPPTTAPSPPTIKPRLGRNLPDEACYFNPDLLKCKSIGEGGICPENFGMNENEQCIPINCPDGFENLDEDESGTCYPVVIEKIDQKINNILTGIPSEPTCKSDEQKNVELPQANLEKDDAVVLAYFGDCHIIGGEAILNLSQENQNRVKLVGITFGGLIYVEPEQNSIQSERLNCTPFPCILKGNISSTDNVINSTGHVISMAVLDAHNVRAKHEGQILKKVNFRETLLGITHTGDNIPIENINALALWNNSTEPVNLDKPVLLNVTISNQSQMISTSEDMNPLNFTIPICSTPANISEGNCIGPPMS